MNNITIGGHLGADPETRFTSSGKKVTTLRVATRTRKANADDTIWWRVTIWGEQYDKIMPYFKKGSSIIVTGDVQKPEIFTDRDGKPQISMNIVAYHIEFSPFGKSDRTGQDSSAAASSAGVTPPAANQASPFGAARESSSPYAPPGVQMGMAAPMQAPGGTFDDE